MDLIEKIKYRAKKLHKTIVLPEAFDCRYIEGVTFLKSDPYANIIFLGSPDKILPMIREHQIPTSMYTLIDHVNHPNFNDYVHAYYEKRKHRHITEKEAEEVMRDPLFYADMMVEKGDADGCLAGASNSTANVIRAALHIIGTKEGINTFSSFFIILLPDEKLIGRDVLFYSDCGVVPNPTSEQLVDIAYATSHSYQQFMDDDPKVAMLSFSTIGSAEHPDVSKVRKAVLALREKFPQLLVDGEMQVDAAIVPSIGKRKAPGSPVAGDANIFIFPDLDAGNIGYKLTERLGGATALGPCFQGLAKAANDLSRGCSAYDISIMIAITAIQSGS